MQANKNIIKGNRFVDTKTVKESEFYAIVRQTVTNKITGDKTKKDFLITSFGTRLHAKNDLFDRAKNMGAELVYFGPFKNKRK